MALGLSPENIPKGISSFSPWFGTGARLCPPDQLQRVNGRSEWRNFKRLADADVLRLVLCTQPRSGTAPLGAAYLQNATQQMI